MDAAYEEFRREMRHNAVLSKDYKSHLIDMALQIVREAHKRGKEDGAREERERCAKLAESGVAGSSCGTAASRKIALAIRGTK